MKVATMVALGVTILVCGTQLSAAADGKAVVDKTCSVCHAKGLMGAPKLGDKAKWAELGKNGQAALEASVAKGKGKMPPQKVSAEDIRAGVEFMLKSGG